MLERLVTSAKRRGSPPGNPFWFRAVLLMHGVLSDLSRVMPNGPCSTGFIEEKLSCLGLIKHDDTRAKR
ncbi:hypothetical protein CY34DRAFT_809392 [Suillus luteus UH-Slu-Lm8-n1]|uniref:Uncharacterized protein n=1 Tax=Suillus luteus UH-Slu-Lm8-n1 TaxID=930992 RepID=A0A0D0AJQ3_9AGAM|nr:hypothetical protein CY34DRAFT_809392 [Suillus luteus UH-Slu-Lm8-n1]